MINFSVERLPFDLNSSAGLALVFPAIQLSHSSTRREELLLPPEILQKTRILSQFMYSMDEIEAMEMDVKRMKAAKNNSQFFDAMRRGG